MKPNIIAERTHANTIAKLEFFFWHEKHKKLRGCLNSKHSTIIKCVIVCIMVDPRYACDGVVLKC